jgi:hypothetical protein
MTGAACWRRSALRTALALPHFWQSGGKPHAALMICARSRPRVLSGAPSPSPWWQRSPLTVLLHARHEGSSTRWRTRLWRPEWTERGASDIGLEAATRLILSCHRCGRARHPGTGTPPMVLLTQPSITGVSLLRCAVDRLRVVPSTEIRTDGVCLHLAGSDRDVHTISSSLEGDPIPRTLLMPTPVARAPPQARRLATRAQEHGSTGGPAPSVTFLRPILESSEKHAAFLQAVLPSSPPPHHGHSRDRSPCSQSQFSTPQAYHADAGRDHTADQHPVVF